MVRRIADNQIYPLPRIGDLDFKFRKMLIVFLINQKDYELCKLRNTLMQRLHHNLLVCRALSLIFVLEFLYIFL